jgi:hypothetical protein
MAVTVTNIFQGTDTSINEIQATADADATAAVPHGLGAAPGEVLFGLIRSQGWLKTPFYGTIDATNVNVNLSTAVGSGLGVPTIRVFSRRPHSIGR